MQVKPSFGLFALQPVAVTGGAALLELKTEEELLGLELDNDGHEELEIGATDELLLGLELELGT